MDTRELNLQSADQNTSSRRAAILMGGAALAGLAFASRAEAAENIDNDVLNFALNLEYLEANYFTLATTGATIGDAQGDGVSGVGTLGTVTVKPTGYASCLVPFTTPLLQEFANELAADERNHVNFLRTALGVTDASKGVTGLAVAMPNIDLYNSFNGFAAAVNQTYAAANPTATAPIIPVPFDPFASELNFLLGAFMFEDVGVSAYHGAAGLLTSKAYLTAAAGILAVEAYHSGSIRTRLFGLGANAQAISQAIATTIAALDQTGNDDIGVGVNAAGQATVVDADANAIAFSRTTLQVRQVVYGPVPSMTLPLRGATGSGGFFPNGMAGNIT